MVYWIFKALITSIILGLVLEFVHSLGTINATSNGQSVTFDTSFLGPFVVFGIPFALFCITALYQLFYYNMFSFVMTSDLVSVTSGVFFQPTKTTDFRAIQNVSTTRGPDISITLVSDEAEQLRNQIAQSAQVQSVKIVQ